MRESLRRLFLVKAATVAANRPVKVVHVGKFYPPVPGGMERIVQSLCAVTKGSAGEPACWRSTPAPHRSDDV